MATDLILYISQSVFICLALKKFALDRATTQTHCTPHSAVGK